MEEKTFDELKQEAIALGIEFKGNIGKAKLQAKIEEYYENQARDGLVDVSDYEEDAEEAEEDTRPLKVRRKEMKRNSAKTQKDNMKAAISEARKRAFTTRKVILTSNDKRDNDTVTTAYLGFENQYFSKDRIVPLDIPVELEQCLIDIALDTVITLHTNELKNGKPTGNKIPVKTKKFSIQYV